MDECLYVFRQREPEGRVDTPLFVPATRSPGMLVGSFLVLSSDAPARTVFAATRVAVDEQTGYASVSLRVDPSHQGADDLVLLDPVGVVNPLGELDVGLDATSASPGQRVGAQQITTSSPARNLDTPESCGTKVEGVRVAAGRANHPPAFSAQAASMLCARKQDLMTLDLRPGLYYVTARNERGKEALLLGPFESHWEAIGWKAAAAKHAEAQSTWNRFLSYGTAKWVDALVTDRVPLGVFNEALLSDAESAKADDVAKRARVDATSARRYGLR